ncbi:MAG: hypothetical protein DRN90_05675 [Thermoproteota archaeon]|nr:MAG: hypothetical protein DRN90_05675 [Candidatus Korarchaeota archaeon]
MLTPTTALGNDGLSFATELANNLRHEPSSPIQAICGVFGSKIELLSPSEVSIASPDYISEFYLFSVMSHLSLHAKYVFTITGLRYLRVLVKEVLRRSNEVKKGFRRFTARSTPRAEPLARALEMSGVLTQFLALSWPDFHINNYERTGEEIFLRFSELAGKTHERHFISALKLQDGIYGKRHRNVFSVALRQGKKFLKDFHNIYESLDFVSFLSDLSVQTGTVIGPDTIEHLKRDRTAFEPGLTYETWIDNIHKELKAMVRDLISSENPFLKERALKLAVFFNKHASPWNTIGELMDLLKQMARMLPRVIIDGKVVLVENLTPENDFMVEYFIDYEILRMLNEGRSPVCPLRKSPQFRRCRVCPGEIFGEINRYCPLIRKWMPR